MEFIKLMFGLLLFCLAIGAVVSIFVFVVDVIKWHDKETRVKVIPSNDEAEKTAIETLSEDNESEVNEDVRNDGEYNSSTLPDPRC